MGKRFDVIIIGAGPGGCTAARILAQSGRTVALVESATVGGVCVHCGCIPTKFLLAATATLGQLRNHARFGSLKGSLEVDFAALQSRKNRFIKGTASALAKSLQSAGVAIFQGVGSCVAPGRVTVSSGGALVNLEGGDIILAAGSRSAAFPELEPDGEAVLDSTMLLNLNAAPESLLIVGAGAIGIEFSDFFAALGTAVTIVEGMPQVIPTEDKDIADELQNMLEKSNRACLTGKKVDSLATVDGKARLRLDDGTELHGEKALVAIGRKANCEGLGVEAIGGALTPRGFVAVDGQLRAAPHCYAIGDINGLTLLAHAADHQGEWVARHILGLVAEEYNPGPVPACVFGHIEVMRVGKTERDAVKGAAQVFTSRSSFSANPIAQAHAANAGFAKAVWEDGVLVGLAAVGHGASHLVTAAQLLVHHRHTPESLHSFMFAHPSLDEILKSVVLAPRTPSTLQIPKLAAKDTP